MTSTAPPRTSTSALPTALTAKNRRQRRWSMALVGVLLMLGAGLAFALLYVNAGERSPVLVVARDVQAGQVIEAADLDVARVGAESGVGSISEASRSDVVGQTAAVDLVSGTLLVPAHLGEREALAEGEAVVGLDLAGGERAVGELREGDRVSVILTGTEASLADGESTDGLGVELTVGRVLTSRSDPTDEERIFLSLVVPEDSVVAISGANSLDRVAIALLPAE